MSGKTPRTGTLIRVYVSAVLLGLLTHFYMLSHKLPNWDDINNFDTPGVSRLYGRWFLDVLQPLSGSFSVPAVNGVLAIFFLGAAAVLLYRILELRSLLSGVLLAAILMTFPSLASTMCFMFTVDLYAVGLVICLAGVLILRCMKAKIPGLLLGILCFILTLGTYQSYICFAIALLVYCLMLDLLNGEELKTVFFSGLRYVAALFLSVLIYLPLSFRIEPEMRTEGQNGLEHLGSNLSPLILLKQFGRTYKRVSEYFVLRPMSFVSGFLHVMMVIAVVFFGVMLVFAAKKKGLFKHPAKPALLLVLTLLLPPALAFFYVMSPEANVSTLMYYQYCLPFLFLLPPAELNGGLKLPEGGAFAKYKLPHMLGYTVFAAVILVPIAWSHLVLTNQAYLRMELAKEHVMAYYNRILYTLEHTEGYSYGDQTAILGNYWADVHPAPIESFHMDDRRFADLSGISTEYGMLTSGVRKSFIKTYLGVDLNTPTGHQLADTKEYREMPVYPAEGCVKKINGVWVVRISSE